MVGASICRTCTDDSKHEKKKEVGRHSGETAGGHFKEFHCVLRSFRLQHGNESSRPNYFCAVHYN